MKNRMGITMWFLVYSLLGFQPLSANGETDVTACSKFFTDPSLSKITVPPMLSETGLDWTFQEKMPAKSTDTDHDSSKTVVTTYQLTQHSRKSMPDKRHYVSIIIGAVYWPNLGGIDPSQAGFNSKQFGKFKAVNEVSFSIKKGEIFGFLGPNGAGKTTTIKLLCGLYPPTSGLGRVAGVDIRKEQLNIRKHIGYMSQKFSLYQDLTVAENLELFAGIYGVSRKDLNERREWTLTCRT